MLFSDERTHLNRNTFNESFSVTHEFALLRNYLKKLPFEINGSIYHKVKMICNENSVDLEEALYFNMNTHKL